jgi:1-acyl-sn-glycerol-3-phosphate acyltransferase
MVFERARRRILTVPAFAIAFVLTTALFPLLLVCAAVADVVRGSRIFAGARLVVFLWVFLAVELLGICALAGVGLATIGSPARRRSMTWPVQRWYTGSLLGAVRGIFGVTLSIAAEEQALVARGPFVVLARHASIVDTLVPAAFIANQHRIRLRYVLKRELLVDPCLDIAGHWLPNHFVSRDGTDSAGEIAAVRALREGLVTDEGVLIYPEGTRFTASKRDKAIARASGDPVALGRVTRLRHVLPPKPGGSMALVDGDEDVIFLGHHGLGGLSRVGDVWRGFLVGRHVRVKIWREPASSVPKDREARLAWLAERWQRLDEWIDELGPEA